MLKFSKGKIGKRALSAFLCAALSFSNVQAVAYASQTVGEGTSIEKETSYEKETYFSVEGVSAEDEVHSSVEVVSSGDEAHTSVEERGQDEKKEQPAAEESEMELTAKSDSEKEENLYLEEGTFTEHTAEGIFVSAKFGENTFPEGTFMKLRPVEDEEVLSAMKEKVKTEKEKKLKEGEEVEIRSAFAVDISFYRFNEEGKEVEVQPKRGKSVEVQLKKNTALEEALSLKSGLWVEEYLDEEEIQIEKSFSKKESYFLSLPDNEELSLVHLPEGKDVELVSIKENEEAISFKGRQFSPYGAVASTTISNNAEKKSYNLEVYWKEAPDPKAGEEFADTGHSYLDETGGDVKKQKNLVIIPPEKNSNRMDKSTILLNFVLKGDKDTTYPSGTVTIDLPYSFFESWNPEHPTTVAYNGSPDKEYEPIRSGIPKAPATNTLSDFNYTLVDREVEGKTVKYYRLTNTKTLQGGMSFTSDFGYSVVPSMVKMEHKRINGEEVGEYSRKLPIIATIDHPNDQYDAEIREDMSVTMRTKVNPLKLSVKHGNLGDQGGIHYSWNPAWGDKPADADDYFYVVWYVDAERAKGSSQAFDYKFEIPRTTPDGGELLGAQKLFQSAYWNVFHYPDSIALNSKIATLKDIAKYLDKAPDPKEYWKVNPIGRSFIGISKEPIKTAESLKEDKTYERGQFSEYSWYSYNGSYNIQRYLALYRYPMAKLTEALKENTDPSKPLLSLKNSVTWTETWADGYVRDGSSESTLEENALIFRPKTVAGNITLDKNHGSYNRAVGALQTLIADGVSGLTMEGHARNYTYFMYADFQADSNSVRMNADGSYTVPESKAVLRDEGEYYLYTLRTNHGIEDFSSNLNTPLKTETTFKLPGTEVYKLTEEDFYYDAVSISSMEVFDVEKDNSPIGFAAKGQARTDYKSYKPIELWIRKKGSNQYEKYGTFQAAGRNSFSFTPEAGYNVVTVNNNPQAVTDTNFIDLEKSFSERISALEFRTSSDAFTTKVRPRFGLKLTPTKKMQEEFQKGINLGKYNYIGGPGYGKVITDNFEEESRLGKNWNFIGFTYMPLNMYSRMAKSVLPYVDSPETSEQTVKNFITIYNEGTLPRYFNEDQYISPYLLREGIIYDLLPAGTYVNPEEVIVGPAGTWEKSTLDFEQGKDYQVEMIQNWENSGQTMMKVSFKTPENSRTLDWSISNKSYLRMVYVLRNPYTNIVDRGTVQQNTAAFVNTSKDTKWIPNFNPEDKEKKISARKTGKLKEPYFQKIMEEAWNNDESHYKTTSIVDTPVNFGAITVLQAEFTNAVYTELHKSFLKENVSYMGDPYQHRLMYQSEALTRTTDTILFDILGEDEERNGDFAGVDLGSMMDKVSFKKGLKTPNTDTLEPEVYYATVIPTKEQRDLGAPKYDKAAYANDTNPNNPKNPGSIWKKWDLKNPANNADIDKSQIKAIAIDARTTKAGERFILDNQGLLLAKVKMTATKDMEKATLRNTNTAYHRGITFRGDDIPADAVSVELESPSYHKVIEPVSFSIPVKKVMNVAEGLQSPDITNAFKFTLKAESGASLLDEKDRPIVTEKTNPDADGGLMEFGKIRILRPGTYTYSVTESGNRPGIENDKLAEKKLIITVKNPDDQKLSYTTSLKEDEPLVFTNSYGVDEVYTEIRVKKLLEHYGGVSVPDISEKFNFTLTALEDAPMPSEAGSNSTLTYTNPDKDGGEIVFGPIVYSAPGVYKYTVKEEGSVENIQNDQSVKNITVTVKDMGDGTLIAGVSGEGQEFRNVLKLKPVTAELSLRKTIEGGKPAQDDEFSFSLLWKQTELNEGGNAGEKLSTDLAPMPGNFEERELQGRVVGEGSLSFAELSFPAPGKYTYEVREDVLPLYGYSFDPTVYRVVFTVEEDPENPLSLVVKREFFKDGSPAEEVLFVNRYNSPTRPGGGGNTPSRPLPPDGGSNGRPNPPSPQEELPGEVLGEDRLSDLDLKEEDKKKGEVLGENRVQNNRATKTGDNSALIVYGIFAGLSAILFGLYMALKKRFSR